MKITNYWLYIFILYSGLISDVAYTIIGSSLLSFHFGSPGEIMRGIHMIILIGLLFSNKISVSKFDMFFISFMIGISFLYLIIVNNPLLFEIKMRLAWSLKILYLLLLISFVKRVLCEFGREKIIKHYLIASMMFVIIPIFLSFFGVLGNSSFNADYRLGYKGIIHAQNSISLLLILFASISLQYSSIKYHSILSIIGMFIVGTKSALIGGVTFIFLFVNKILSNNRNIIKVLLLIVIIVFFGYLSVEQVINIQKTNIKYYQHVYNSSGSFLYTFTSGRWMWFGESIDYFKGLNIYEMILGTHLPQYNEMDPLALFTRYGFIGLIWYFAFLTHYYNSIINHSKKIIFIKVGLLFIIFHSILGGHVIGNAIIALPLALLLCLGIRTDE